MLRDFLERRRVKRVFSKIVGGEAANSILEGRSFRKPLSEGSIEFVLVFVRGDSAPQISERVGKVVDIALTHHAMIHGFIGPLVTLVFGMLPAAPARPASRLELVDDLCRQLADSIKIVHGAAQGHYGLLGSEKHVLSYSFIVPRFDAALGTLSRLEFGQVEEFNP